MNFTTEIIGLFVYSGMLNEYFPADNGFLKFSVYIRFQDN